jgi:hypothetical protein
VSDQRSYAIEYETAGVVFEFTPAAGTKGDLSATADEQTVIGKVDLTSAKSRTTFVKEAYELYPEAFTLTELEFRRALNDLATHVDEQLKIRDAKAEEDDDEVASFAPEVGSERYDAAMEILTSDDVLEAAAKTMLSLGHVGEWKNKKLAFISAVSARAGLPVQPSTHAQSSAGKNHLWDTVLALIPPELVYKRTGFSAKALFRTQMSLKHSILYIQELAGSEGADFSIRTLQSDNVLKWEATEKQADGTLANVEYEVEGPTVIVQTTTRNHLHPENETRVVPIYLDETAEQTERITKEVLRRAAGKGAVSETEREAMCEAWHDVVRLLEPAEVIVPFAERIKVPTQPIRLRRDVPRLISIIRLVAWVHQHTRERDEAGRVLATEDDFDTAIGIAGDSFARAWKSLIPSEEKVYEACKEYIPGNLQKHGFKRSHVENALRKGGESLSLSTVKDCLYTLSRSGFLESDGKRGVTGATYTLAGASTFTGRITLAGHSAIREKSGESRIDKATSMAESDSGPSRPFGYGDDTERPNGQEWPKATRPLKMGDLQEQPPNGRMADENPANTKNGVASKTLFGDGGEHGYEYTEDE